MAEKVFATGATGFTATAIVSQLINPAYEIPRLTPSDERRQSLLAAETADASPQAGAECLDDPAKTRLNHRA